MKRKSMNRKQARPAVRPAEGFEPQSSAPIHPSLSVLGWRRTARGTAERYDKNGRCEAFIDVEVVHDANDRLVTVWRGHSMTPQRRTRQHYPTASEAMDAVECAEALGPLGSDWEDQSGPPGHDGWGHWLRLKRHIWARPTADRVPMIVRQLPVEPSLWPQPLRYVVAIDGQYLTCADGQTREYTNPTAAMESAERNAIRQGHSLPQVAETRDNVFS